MKRMLVWIYLLWLFFAIHPPNENKICQRDGCRHYKFSHHKGNGPCLFVGPDAPEGHCVGFLR